MSYLNYLSFISDHLQAVREKDTVAMATRASVSEKMTLKIFQPNGSFNSVKCAETTDIKVK